MNPSNDLVPRLPSARRTRSARWARARQVLALSAALSSMTVPLVGHARAEPAAPSAADKSSARELMRDGKALRDKGDHRGALQKFKAAYAYVPSPVTGVAVARAQVALGELVEARATLDEVLRLPARASETDDGRKARKEAQLLLADLVTRIPSIVVRVGGVPADAAVVVQIDGAIVPAVAAAEGRHADPGPHQVRVRVEGFVEREASVVLVEGERRELAFELVPVLPEPPRVAPEPVVAPVAAPRSAPLPVVEVPAQPDRSRDRDTQRWVGLSVGGVGAVLMGVGGIVGLTARSRYVDAREAHCPSGLCDAEGKQRTDAAHQLGDRATIFAVVGAACVVGGVVIWLTSPEEGRARRAGSTRLIAGPGSLSLAGEF